MQQRHTYDMGLIGNCGLLALVHRDTNIDWMCLPRFDSSFVFGRLIGGEQGGEFSILPAEGEYTSEQAYVENTNVLQTVIKGADYAYRVTDFAPRFRQLDRMYRPLMLIRKIEPLQGLPRIRVCCRPVYDYGERSLRSERGSNHIRFFGMEETLRLSTDIPLNHITEDRSFVLMGCRYMILTYGVPLEAGIQGTAEDFYQKTVNYWRRWVKSTSIGLHYQKEVIRSSLVLKIHQFEDTGGIIASPTTSLPEAPGSTRNWDYRYCWMRDAYYTLTAFNNIGHFEEMERYFSYLMNIPPLHDTERIQPLYDITGEAKLTELELPLPGYQGEQPVRIGNDAYTHIQNDVYGQILLAILPLYTDQRFIDTERVDSSHLLENIVRKIEMTIEEKDAGIWEFRNKAQVHAYTNLFQWAGSAAALKMARRIGNEAMAKRAEKLKKRAAELIESCYDPQRKVYTQAQGGRDLDASTLQLIMMNYLPHDSARAADHLRAMEAELKAGKGLFYRYLHQDDFGKPKTTFLICAFWYVEALACVKRFDEAMEAFEEICQYANPLGLLSEDVHHADGSQWGNFPQAYSHVGLVNAAYRIHNKLNEPTFFDSHE